MFRVPRPGDASEAPAEHRTRFDAEIVPGRRELPLRWVLGDERPGRAGRTLRRSGQEQSVGEDADGGRHEAWEAPRQLPTLPGARDAYKLDSQIWYRGPAGAPELAAHGPA
ncbi:MAG: hypothetical protein ACRDJN_19285, partial [Chloroflexota bacterium]